MREMPQVSYVNGCWQISTRDGGDTYVLRFHEYVRVDPTDWTFVKVALDQPEIRLVADGEAAAGANVRPRTPVENEILTDLQTRWRALAVIAAF